MSKPGVGLAGFGGLAGACATSGAANAVAIVSVARDRAMDMDVLAMGNGGRGCCLKSSGLGQASKNKARQCFVCSARRVDASFSVPLEGDDAVMLGFRAF